MAAAGQLQELAGGELRHQDLMKTHEGDCGQQALMLALPKRTREVIVGMMKKVGRETLEDAEEIFLNCACVNYLTNELKAGRSDYVDYVGTFSRLLNF